MKLARARRSWTTWLACCFVAAVPALSAGGTATLMNGQNTVTLTGESGKDSNAFTLQFTTSGKPPTALTFLPGDLTQPESDQDKAGARIDSAQVRIAPTPAIKAKPGFDTYEVSVATLPERSGSYTGMIAVYVNGKPAGTVLTVQLTVVPAQATVLDPDPRNVSVALINRKWVPGGELLAGRPEKAKLPVAVPALPAGAKIAAVRVSPLVAVGGDSTLAPTLSFDSDSAKAPYNRALVTLDASQARPGKYTSIAQLRVAGTDRWISVPIEVTVRVGPWLVVALIVLGVVVGRIVKYMNERGSQILAIVQRYRDWLARVESFDRDLRSRLADTRAELQRLERLGDYTALDTALTEADTRIALMKRAIALQDMARIRGSESDFVELAKWLDVLRSVDVPAAAISTALDKITTRLTTGADAARAADDAGGGMGTKTPALVGVSRFTVRVARILAPVLTGVTIVALAFIGFESLYVNGPATFGANPATDYLSAIIWGLSADVAGRTLGNLGRTVAAK